MLPSEWDVLRALRFCSLFLVAGSGDVDDPIHAPDTFVEGFAVEVALSRADGVLLGRTSRTKT